MEPSEQKPWWKTEFKNKFSTNITWIKLNCKDEIIQGIDINHLDEILLSFISEVANRTRREVLQMAANKAKDEGTRKLSVNEEFNHGHQRACFDIAQGIEALITKK